MKSQFIKRYLKQFFPLVLIWVFVLGGCSSGPPIQEIPNTANVAEELQKFNADMNEAAADQVNVLSPRNFKEALASLEDAKTGLEKQYDSKDILYDVATGRAYLKRAQEVAALSHTNMEEVVIARQQAIASGAPWSFASDFDKADSTLRNVTADIEKNNMKSAEKNRSKLQASYLDLELQGIKKQHLGSAKLKIKKAIDEGAEKMAPQTLAVAEKNYKDTDAYVTANRHELGEIKYRAQVVNASADHLLKITEDSKNTKKTSPEELALSIESKQNKLTKKQKDLNAEQDISQSLTQEKLGLQKEVAEKQSDLMIEQSVTESLAAENKELYNQADEKENDLAAEKAVTQSLGSANKALATEKDFNEKFEKARSKFTQDEAEVYKQGDMLTIRLRGLEFPSAQAALKNSDFALLGKVQRVIKEFNNSSVVIEGHTDSSGSKTKNAKLSKERAQAVRAYLLSIDAISPDKIQAIGSGDQKPLATNKTTLGRAQNRRVDVLIKVQKNQKL
jgi:outer membrane protein OmpA-like peptidoglycan-associated protein